MKQYSVAEEKMNIISHGIGFILSVIGFVLLLGKPSDSISKYTLKSYVIYGLSMCFLYAASTLYHSAKESIKRHKLRTLDHIAIYFLIAGTYTPFCLVTLENSIGLEFFFATWTMALVGTIFKIFFTGKYDRVSTIMYVIMGWSAIIAIKPLMEYLPSEGLYWLLAGGLSYTIGAILYGFKSMKYNHAIFHVFVLVGSFCHFISIYLYV